MKAIALHQPWASLIACGTKPFETRSWAPPRNLIGATIAICASKNTREGRDFAQDVMLDDGFGVIDRLEASWGNAPAEIMGAFGRAFMPIGCVVCTARLAAAFQLGDPLGGSPVPAARIVRRLSASLETRGHASVPYDDFGDYAPGRWAWLLRDVKPLKPPPRVVGRQGFFELPQGWAA